MDEDLFSVLTYESGIHLNRSNNLAGDVLIFDNTVLPISAIGLHYVSVPPKISIEVDIDADTKDLGEDGYIYGKTQKLLDFGCEKVIWITTKNKKVLIATQNNDWILKDWNKDVEVFDDI